MTTHEMTMDEQIAYIREHLAAWLAERDGQMEPCLSEEEIASFERRNGVRLPESYRRFLLEVGNLSFGPPDYGLEPLDPHEEVPNLAKPYPFTESCYIEPWKDANEGHPDRSKYASIEHGVLFLGAKDDEDDWMLVVMGDERGQIWMHFTLGIAPLAPRRDFLDWYIYWLDGGSDWWAALNA